MAKPDPIELERIDDGHHRLRALTIEPVEPFLELRGAHHLRHGGGSMASTD